MKRTLDSAHLISPSGMILANIAISKIKPFADQPRKEFDQDDLAGLSMSIKEIGQQTPAQLKLLENDPDYEFELIDGERRFRACILAGISHLLAVVEPDMDQDEQFARSVASNFCRAGHTPMETAFALRIMVDGFLKNGVDGEDVGKDGCIEVAARICGRSYAWAQQHLSLLRLCPEVQESLIKKEISFQVGIALSGLKEEYQAKYVRHIVDKNLNHRNSLAYIRNNRKPEFISEHGRVRKPANDRAIFSRTVEKLISEFNAISDMPMDKILKMFESRSAEDFEQTVSDLENLSQSIQSFVGTLRDESKV